jgi:signal transduction histidine kinase
VNPPRLLDSPTAPHGAADQLSGLCTAVLEALPHAVALFDPDGGVLRANPAFRALLEAAGIGGAAMLADVAAHGGEVLEAATVRAARGNRVGPVCVPFGRVAARLMDATLIPLALPDGRLGLAMTLSPSTAIDGQAATSTNGPPASWPAELDALRDEQARRARERRLAAVGQLAAGVMHDVNNALNPIVAAAHLLDLNATNPEAVRDYARRISRAAETAAATAARVGRFIRQEPLAEGTHRLVDLCTLADEVVEMTRSQWAERAGGTVQLESACPPGVQVRGCAGELREVLLNLVQNALDAMQGGGTLGVRVVQTEHLVTLYVSDTGVGMSPEVRERAFEPFYTTKGVSGTGLGLSEVWGVIKRHRGHAEIDSMPGVGTTVQLVFPRPDAARRVTGEMLVAGAARMPRRVLLVEDHEDGRELMRTVLATDGHQVDAVGCLGDARQRLGVSGAYDVLVTDLGLPDGSGLDLVREARVRWPGLRVVVVTGWEPHELRESLPAHFTLRKPVRAPELLACVGADA